MALHDNRRRRIPARLVRLAKIGGAAEQVATAATVARSPGQDSENTPHVTARPTLRQEHDKNPART
ncbi:MAG TPA: hypothetical protein VHZ03_05460 [Trebonia sp.]|nr:hypothetical protein [Trebonia sp.]